MQLQIHVVLLLAAILGANGYHITNSHRVYYKGQYINITGAEEATSQSAHEVAQSVYRHFYSNIILKQDIGEIDITILLDCSVSIGLNNYENAKYFLSTLVALMSANNFPAARVRVSMYTFSESIHLTREFAFNDMKYRELIRRRILSTDFCNITYSHLTTALIWMNTEIQTTARPSAKKVLLVATDSNSNDDSVREDGRGLNGPISDLQQQDVETFVVALGENVDITKTAVIASAPDKDHIFHLKNTVATATVMQRLIRRMSAQIGHRGRR